MNQRLNKKFSSFMPIFHSIDEADEIKRYDKAEEIFAEQNGKFAYMADIRMFESARRMFVDDTLQ
jgi:hypothetical protein